LLLILLIVIIILVNQDDFNTTICCWLDSMHRPSAHMWPSSASSSSSSASSSCCCSCAGETLCCWLVLPPCFKLHKLVSGCCDILVGVLGPLAAGVCCCCLIKGIFTLICIPAALRAVHLMWMCAALVTCDACVLQVGQET
jgi:hypothetical protein